jgi:DNA-binding NtrC family response regulator
MIAITFSAGERKRVLQPRILAVDDSNETRMAVQAILERQQMQVMLAESVDDGLGALSQAYFDLVITDFRMPRKSGLDLVQETRDHGVNVPFILLTADADPVIRKMAVDIGVAAVLKKPIRKQTLLDHVGRALSNSRLRGAIPYALPHRPCTAQCTFSVGGFCSLPTKRYEPLTGRSSMGRQ